MIGITLNLLNKLGRIDILTELYNPWTWYISIYLGLFMYLFILGLFWFKEVSVLYCHYRLRMFPFICSCLSFFIRNGCWILLNFFSASVKIIVVFVSLVYYWWVELCWWIFHRSSQPCVPGIYTPLGQNVLSNWYITGLNLEFDIGRFLTIQFLW